MRSKEVTGSLKMEPVVHADVGRMGREKGTERHGPGLRRLASCSACCSLLCWGYKICSWRRAGVQRDLKKTDFLKKPVRIKSPMKPETNLSSGNGHSG